MKIKTSVHGMQLQNKKNLKTNLKFVISKRYGNMLKNLNQKIITQLYNVIMQWFELV